MQVIKFFFLILFGKIKIIFNKPYQKNLIVFDDTSFNDLKYLFKDKDYFLLSVRSNMIKKIYINKKIILLVLKNYKKLNLYSNRIWTAYLVSLIQLIEPKLVITHIDNSLKFSDVSKFLQNKYNFLTIQNAARYDLIIDNQEKNLVKNLFIQNFCCFGQYEIDLYKKLKIDVKKFHLVGSIRKSNFFHYLAEKKINVNKNLFKIGVLLEVPLNIAELNDNVKHFVTPVKYSIRFCLENNYKPIFIEKLSDINYHLNLFGNFLSFKEKEFIKKNSIKRNFENYSSYQGVFQSEVVVGIASTLLREKISSGEKILSCNYSSSKTWDFPIKGICQTKDENYETFSKVLSKILKLSNQEYLKQIDSDISYVMCKENDSSTIEKIDNLIRKMSD